MATAKGKLAQTLNSLQLPDGTPDIEARRTEYVPFPLVLLLVVSQSDSVSAFNTKGLKRQCVWR